MNWKEFIRLEKDKDYFKNLVQFLLDEGKKHTIYPPSKNVFEAFNKCPLDQVKILIMVPIKPMDYLSRFNQE